MRKLSSLVNNHPLTTFFILAYAFSWGVEIPLALQANELIKTELPFALHYLAAYGPMTAAILVTYLTDGKVGLRRLFKRMVQWRVRPVWWLVAASPLGFYLLAALAGRLVGGSPIALAALGQVDFLPALGLAALPMWILTFGIGEETGWRGFALPRLQRGRSALSATIILWLLWGFWHLPMFFYSYPVSILPGFAIGLLAGAITFTWLYNSTRGSILLVAVWHGLYNFTTACVSCKTGLSAALISGLVMVWAVILITPFSPVRLSQVGKHTI